MTHLSEEELIAHYYEEKVQPADAEQHLKACADCATHYAELQRDLDAVKPLKVPARGENYGEEVWRSLRGSLPPRAPVRFRRLNAGLWKAVGWASACVLLIAATFLAGRQWQRKQLPSIAPTSNLQARQRVVTVVLRSHLERSERLLVQIKHLETKDTPEVWPIQDEARELLAVNRLVKQSMQQTADLTVDAALDGLERLFVEIANEPDGLSQADVNRLRQEMNTGDLLFEVRILRSRIARQQETNATGTKGVSL